jgi:hypothetical protein
MSPDRGVPYVPNYVTSSSSDKVRSGIIPHIAVSKCGSIPWQGVAKDHNYFTNKGKEEEEIEETKNYESS